MTICPARPLLDFLNDHSMDSVGMEEKVPHGQRNFLDCDDVGLDIEMPSGRPIGKPLESATENTNDETDAHKRRHLPLFLSDSDLDPESDAFKPNRNVSAEN
jgi:hypothetical protein